jgi:hypothetical protein
MSPETFCLAKTGNLETSAIQPWQHIPLRGIASANGARSEK